MPQTDEERKAYYREYNKRWYQIHKERLLQKRKQHATDLRSWREQYKSKLQCLHCGEDHPACLQFHHRDRTEKSFNVGSAIGQWKYITLKRLEEEISKCDVLCGNCHAKLHWDENQQVRNGVEWNALQR